jgi:hypothetical protein
MTAIVIWLNNENPANPSLWIASDSRVSKHDSTLIDDAVKIFALPIVCRSPGKEGFFSQISYFHTYGYCFAGSTLLGQNTFLALIPLLSNLVTVERYIPQMSDVADFILEYNEKKNINLKRDEVDWQSSRIIFISQEFSQYQKNSINYLLIALFCCCYPCSKLGLGTALWDAKRE